MATKKSEVIDLKPLVITQPALYEVSIQGLDSILFNRMLSKDETANGTDAKEGYEEREWRIWKKKAYVDDNGILYIPGENIHECMKEGAKYWGQKIPGEGNKTYTDLIASAVICESISLGVHIDSDEVIPYDKMVNGNPSKGKKSGAKVLKVRPLLRPWGGAYKMHVFDARLTPDVLKVIIAYAGTFRGLCDWRPQFGRFELTNIKKI
jgi:hypothetical protein